MKIALIGYGKMGRAIEQIALERGHETGFKVDSRNLLYGPEDLEGHDVAIEFSVPHGSVRNIQQCVKAGVPIVVGTTGWYEHFEAIEAFCKEHNGALFHATNFSIGVHLFSAINRQLAGLMNDQPDYKGKLKETHHVHKLDAPSGTAITLANQIIDQHNALTGWSDKNKPAPEELPITSIRKGEVPGTHAITWDSAIDTIEITHKAKSRMGFAAGAVKAAEWLVGRTGIYTMNDLLNL